MKLDTPIASSEFLNNLNLSLKENLIKNSKHPNRLKALDKAFLDYPTKLRVEFNYLRWAYIVSSVFMSDVNKGKQLYTTAEYVLEESNLQKYLTMCFSVSIKTIFSHIRWKRKLNLKNHPKGY